MAIRITRKINGKELSIESGRMAKQANGSVLVQYTDTVVLCTATMDEARPGINFFPLTVDYREKTSAAGKIPGGFFKREGRPTTKEILTCRMIDRPTRPLFPDGFKKEIQIQCMVLSADDENESDVLAMIGASAALAISDIPWQGPTGSTRIGHVDGKMVAFPTFAELEESDLNLVVAGTRDAITMVEAGASEVSEATIIDALEAAQKQIQTVVGMIDELVEKIGHEKIAFQAPEPPAMLDEVRGWLADPMADALSVPAKHARTAALKALKDECLAHFVENEDERIERKGEFREYFGAVEHEIMRRMIKAGQRVDGRGEEDIRPITTEVQILPRTHGSCLFTRGETQAIATCTLGTTSDKQIVDGLQETVKSHFLLHYSFPPFSVGECRPIRGPGRREIGHGCLAERAIQPILPALEDFPYTVRIVSDILESNGSSSMATVCAGSMCLMDAGVKIERPVAGIAMGLLREEDEFIVLSDILGDEDHHGDMDFKVAGTDRGITALQMDIKIDGVTREVLSDALEQARHGRLHILKEMLKALKTPRTKMSPYAPRVAMVKINPEKIGLVIGPGGKTVRKIQEETGAKIEIVDEKGNVAIYATNDESLEGARSQVEALTAEAEIGRKYLGKVTGIKDFGAFIEIIPGQDGLLHISDMGNGYVDRVSDIYSPGDTVEVVVADVNDFGKIRLVLADAGPAGDAPAKDSKGPGRDRDSDRKPRGDRGGRGGRDRDRDRDRDSAKPKVEVVEEEVVEEEVIEEEPVEEFDEPEADFEEVEALEADDADEFEDEEEFEDEFEDEEEYEDEEEDADEEAPEEPRPDDRGARGGDRGGRGGERGERGERGGRGGRGGSDRGGRGGERGGSDRGGRGGERGGSDRGGRGGERGGSDRGGRGGERTGGDRGGRGGERTGSDRGGRGGERTGGDRGGRGGERTGGDRGGRGGERTGGDRGGRGGERTGGDRGGRGGERTGGDRGGRGGERTGGDRGGRGGERTGGDRGGRGGERTGGDRGGRGGERTGGDRGGRGGERTGGDRGGRGGERTGGDRGGRGGERGGGERGGGERGGGERGSGGSDRGGRSDERGGGRREGGGGGGRGRGRSGGRRS